MKIFGLANFRTSFIKTITNNPTSVIQGQLTSHALYYKIP